MQAQCYVFRSLKYLLPGRPSSGDYAWPPGEAIAARCACPNPGSLQAVTYLKQVKPGHYMSCEVVMMNKKNKTICIAGIDTDVGKSFVTGLFGRYLRTVSGSVSSMKLVQTGCKQNISEDIVLHRQLMGISMNEYDNNGTSCPYVFSYPASPRLAARLDHKIIETEVLDKASAVLQKEFEWLLVEGAGGLMVPLNKEMLLIDYLERKNYPMILVTSSKLGSINHTRLSLEALKNRGIRLLAMAFNLHNPSSTEIVRDSLQEYREALDRYGYKVPLLLVPEKKASESINWEPVLRTLLSQSSKK